MYSDKGDSQWHFGSLSEDEFPTCKHLTVQVCAGESRIGKVPLAEYTIITRGKHHKAAKRRQGAGQPQRAEGEETAGTRDTKQLLEI